MLTETDLQGILAKTASDGQGSRARMIYLIYLAVVVHVTCGEFNILFEFCRLL